MSLGAAGDPRSYEHRDEPEKVEFTVNGLRENERLFTPQGDTVVAQAFSAVEKVREEHRNHLQAVDSNDDLTDEARARAVAAFKDEPAAKYLDVVQEAVNQRAAEAQARYDAQLAGLSKDGDAAQESRNLRIRDRVIDTLKSSDSPVIAAQQMTERATTEELSVILQEVPSFLENRRLPTGFIQAVVEQKLPELAAARREVTRAEQAKTVVDYDIQAIRSGIQSGYPPKQLVNPLRYDPDA
ncbi:MAG: hypothetical protein ACLP75_14000 [Mycobacterium sp.]|uniref:hypothetical protein n=1 Tax=Mycobacterium sp. TaxID=1785 RepID=UPI003F9BE02C